MNDNRLNSKELAKIDFAVELAEKAHTGITLTAEQARNLLDKVAYWVQRYADTTKHLYTQRDDLQAQLAARVEEIRDVVEERDEARRVAGEIVQLLQESGDAVEPRYLSDPNETQCVWCHGPVTEEGVQHTRHCSIGLADSWSKL